MTDAEVVVIGGGIVSVASAYYLAQRGIRVLRLCDGRELLEVAGCFDD